MYKKNDFFAGMGDIPTNVYTKQNKKNFLFTMLFETVILLVCHGYFLCVTAAYTEDMHGPPEDENKEDEDKKSSASNKTKGSKGSKAAKDGEAAPAGGDWTKWFQLEQVWIKSSRVEDILESQCFESWEV